MVLSFSVKSVKVTLFQKHDQPFSPAELAMRCAKPLKTHTTYAESPGLVPRSIGCSTAFRIRDIKAPSRRSKEQAMERNGKVREVSRSSECSFLNILIYYP